MSDFVAFQVDESQPKARNLAVWGTAILVVFIAVVCAIKTLFYTQAQARRESPTHVQADPTLRQGREQQQERLRSVGWSEKNKGTVHIPIEEAMRLELDTRNKPSQEKRP